jgi:hypothetical protein
VPLDHRSRQLNSPAAGRALSPDYKRDSPTFDQDYRRERDHHGHADAGNDGPGGFRNGGYARGAAPLGPSHLGNGHGGRGQRQRSPHYDRNPALSAPTQPRTRGGGHSRGRGGYYGDGPGGGRGGPPPPSSRDSPRDYPPRDYPPRSPIGGGRGSRYDGGNRGYGPRADGPPHSSGPPVYRNSANSTSTTYPRTQVFNSTRANGSGGGGGGGGGGAPADSSRRSSGVERHLADLPPLEPNGRRYPASVPDAAAMEAKARRLDEEADKLRKLIAEKQQAKQTGMREWGRAKAETESARTRGDFAEDGVRRINGEHRDREGPAF